MIFSHASGSRWQRNDSAASYCIQLISDAFMGGPFVELADNTRAAIFSYLRYFFPRSLSVFSSFGSAIAFAGEPYVDSRFSSIAASLPSC